MSESRTPVAKKHTHPVLSSLPPQKTKKGKIVSADEAIRVIRDGDTVATGGFVGTGFPEEIAVVMTGETVVSVASKSDVLPAGYQLRDNYPNPFNPQTNISYTIASAEYVRLTIYDLRGRQVSRLVSAVKMPGKHNVLFDASDLPGGVYLYELQVGDRFKEIKKMALVK